MGFFFTQKWFPTNLIILTVLLLIIGFLIWGGLTNWKFISKKQTTRAPAPIPPNTYFIITSKLDARIGYDNINGGSIQPSNQIHKQKIHSVYIDSNKNFVIKILSENQYPLEKNFFKDVKVFGEYQEFVFFSEFASFKDGTWSWTPSEKNNIKWDINKKYTIIFTGDFPQPKKSTSPPTPSPTTKPTPPTPKPICKKSVLHNEPPLDQNICSVHNDCCQSDENIKCMKCIPQDASGLIPKFLQCQGTPKSYCQYNNQLKLFPYQSEPVSSFAISLYGFNIAILGGRNRSETTDLVQFFDPNSESWKATIPNTMTTLRKDFASVFLNDNLYAIGGRTGNDNILNTVEMFNSTMKESWIKVSCLLDYCESPSSLSPSSCLSKNGIKYMGVCSQCEKNQKNIDQQFGCNCKYTCANYIPNMKYERYGHNAVVFNRKIYVLGGINSTFPNGINIIEVYDPIINSWTSSDDYRNPNAPPILNTPRSFGQTVTFNDKIYVLGGLDNSTVQYYDPSVSTRTWNDYVSLDKKRSHFSAVVARAVKGVSSKENEMSIYIMGGKINNSEITDNVQILDTKLKKWVNLSPLGKKRAFCQAACPILWNNTEATRKYIYLFGGLNDKYELMETVEKFDTSGDKKTSWKIIKF